MRTPEEHLTPAEVFRRSNGSCGEPLPAGSAALQEHAAQCSECSLLLQLHEALTMLPGPTDGNSGECIAEDEIYRLAAGLAPADATALTRHIGGCSRCAQLLKQALHDLGSDDAMPVEPGHLESSTRSWQQGLAVRMAQERSVAFISDKTAEKTGQRRRGPWLWIAGPIAAALIAVAALGYFEWSKHRVERLIAAAYNTQRLTELRIPGGKPVPLYSPRLGEASSASLTTELLEATIEIQKHLHRNSEDPYWLQKQGEVELVERQGDEAIESLSRAAAANSALTSSPSFELDLAAANYEIGEAGKKQTEQGKDPYEEASNLDEQAIENLSRTGPTSLLPIAYYNCALAWEKRGVNGRAIENYKTALSKETDPAWRRDIQTQIDRLKAISSTGGVTDQPFTIPPPAELLSRQDKPSSAVPDNYEIYLEAATRSWMSERGSSSSADLALHRLAGIGLRHNDAWVRDILALPASEGDRHLAAAVNASALGRAGVALAESETSSTLYRFAGNRPGYLRAQAEMVYAFQRLGRSRDCLQHAAPLLRDPQLERDAWLRGYLLLEVASCRAAAGDVALAGAPLRESLAIARHELLPLEELRAQSFVADELDALGQSQKAWVLASEQLRVCAATRGSEMQTYQFLSTMYFGAKTVGMPWAAAALAEEAAHVSRTLENRQIQAYAEEELGSAEIAVHHLQAADVAFTSATEQLNSFLNGNAASHDDTARSLYEADWTADRAALLEQSGDISGALDRISSAKTAVDASDNLSLRQRHFTEYAHLLLSGDQPQQAAEKALQAAADAEHAGRTLRTGIENLTWDRDNSRGYRLLVEALIDRGDPELSLRAWEWYRSAPYRRATWAPDDRLPAVANLQPMPQIPQVPHHELVLVYARLDDRYVAWSVSSDRNPQVRLVSLPAGTDDLSSLVQTQASLIRDPASPVSANVSLGARAFRELISPFADQLADAAVLRIDLDPSLQALPFAALYDAGRGWLGSSRAIAILPPWWSLHALEDSFPVGLERALIVAGNPQADREDSATRVPDQYNESAAVAAKFRRAQLLRYPAAKTANLFALLPSAEVFHFNGHAIDREGVTSLLLADQDDLLTASSFPAGSLHACRIAVLAGCTTIGRSAYQVEDPRSLVNAMLLAGARNVIATQWDVDARASRDLMLHFYDALLGGASPAEALHSAQLALLASPATAHPYYWAAYQTYSR
jgi:CHAT domain-containing protein